MAAEPNIIEVTVPTYIHNEDEVARIENQVRRFNLNNPIEVLRGIMDIYRELTHNANEIIAHNPRIQAGIIRNSMALRPVYDRLLAILRNARPDLADRVHPLPPLPAVEVNSSTKNALAGFQPRTGTGLNPWITHVKKVQKEKGISYKEAMKIAKQTY
jgi:hypothetical protein